MSTYRDAAGVYAAFLAATVFMAGCGQELTLQADPTVEVNRSTPAADHPHDEVDVVEGDGGAGTSSVGADAGSDEAAEPDPIVDPIDEPSCEETDSCPRRVFVTSERRAGYELNTTMADDLCTNLARAAGLSARRFVAWFSTTNRSVLDRFMPHNGPYVRPDKKRVAADLEALMNGDLENAIELDERGVRQTGVVWTGTRPDGSPVGVNCDGWSEADEMGAVGRISTSRALWSYSETVMCWNQARLYCFEQ